jgi:hypothetical protein
LDLAEWKVPVDVVAIDAQVAKEKTELERYARRNILTAIRRRYPDAYVDCFGADGKVGGFLFDPIQQHGLLSNRFTYNQMLPWIVGAMQSIRSHTSHVEIGYVLGDDAINALPFLAEAFRLLTIAIIGREVKVYFPCAQSRKQMLYKRLSEHYVQTRKRRLGPRMTPMQRIRRTSPHVTMLDLTWVCEMPVGHQMCGKCHPCKREAQVRAEVGLKPRQARYQWVEREPSQPAKSWRSRWQIRNRLSAHRAHRFGARPPNPEQEGVGCVLELDMAVTEVDVTDVFGFGLDNIVHNLASQSA